MYEGIDTVVLYEELAYQDVIPLTWRPLTAGNATEMANQLADRNLRVLQACVALEEHGQVEKTDDNAPYAADIMRLDMKINLLLDLVGRILIANQPRPQSIDVRFNAIGASWAFIGVAPKPGDEGVFEVYLKDCLVEPLRLVGRVVTVSADAKVKVKFANPGEAIADLMEKMAFRKHRRQVADARQPRERSAADARLQGKQSGK
jgi:hypothetical protein